MRASFLLKNWPEEYLRDANHRWVLRLIYRQNTMRLGFYRIPECGRTGLFGGASADNMSMHIFHGENANMCMHIWHRNRGASRPEYVHAHTAVLFPKGSPLVAFA